MQARRLHSQRRAYQRRLQRDCYERQARAATEANPRRAIQSHGGEASGLGGLLRVRRRGEGSFHEGSDALPYASVISSPSTGWDEGHEAAEMHRAPHRGALRHRGPGPARHPRPQAHRRTVPRMAEGPGLSITDYDTVYAGSGGVPVTPLPRGSWRQVCPAHPGAC